MKRILAVLFIMAVCAGTAFSFDRYTPGRIGTQGAYQAVVPLQGNPRSAPGVVHIDNVARTIQALFVAAGGTYLGGTDNTMSPIAALLACDSVAVRLGFGITPTATIGTPFPAASSWILPGPTWVSTGMAIAAGATDNAACSIVLVY